MHAKSQTAMEFTLLIAAVLVIFLPIFFILSDASINTSSQIIDNQVTKIGRKLVDESREVYYLGLFSKQVVTVNIPERVISMNTVIINDSGAYENYLFIEIYKDGFLHNITFASEVPLVGKNPCYLDPDIATGCSDPPLLVTALKCYRCPFDSDDITPSTKHFKLETIRWKSEYAVNITQVYLS